MGNRLQINIPKLILEFFSVLLGVLLAFSASEWQEEREKTERAEKALVGIFHELEQNSRTLQHIHENNKATVALMATDDDDDDDDITFIPGVQLQSAAWESMQATGVGANIPYQTMMLLSQCYAIMNVYVSTGHKLTESSLTMAAVATVLDREIDNAVFQRQFGSFFTMIVGIEEELIRAMAESMAYLQEHHPL